jgi:hypothetical protein
MRKPSKGEQDMHQPDSERKIEITIDGERVCGTVRYTGAADISVRLDEPANDWSDGVHMPNFARPVYPEGFLGAYGQKRALELLANLYKEQKKGDRRRRFAGSDFEAFGRVRYLAVNPGYPAREQKVGGQARIYPSVYAQMEEHSPYGLVRFFDSETKQPFLAESAVYEASIQEYVNGVETDTGFSRVLKK